MIRRAIPPGLRSPLLASAVGRLPAGAMGLVLVLLTHERTGSFADGGAVAAASAVGFACGAPVLGRLMDRRGQAGVLLAGAAVHCAAMAFVVVVPDDGALAPSMAGAFFAGAGFPPLSSALRSVWNTELAGPQERHAAYAVDSVVGELTYVLGPLLLVGAIGPWSFEAAAVATAALVGVGTAAYCLLPAVRAWRPPSHQGPRGRLGPLRSPAVLALMGAALLLGVAIAPVEIGVAAFAEREGSKAATGIVLGLWGVGSMVGGVWAVRRGPGGDLPLRLAVMLALVAAATAPLAAAPSLVVLGALIVPAGFFIAPAMALLWGVAADVSPPGTVTEVSTWLGTGVGAGIAIGGAGGGWLVEHVAPESGFVVAAVLIGAAAALVALRRDTLAVAPAPAPA